MGDIAGERRFADAVGADQDDVGGVLEEVEGHQGFEGRTIAAFGPTPIEVTDRFEAADMGGAQTTLQAAAGALLLLPIEQHADPFGGGGFPPVCQDAVQVERLGTRAQSVEVIHRSDP